MIIEAIMASAMGGGGLPVIELTTVPTSEGAPLTSEEIAKLEVALAAKSPIVIRFTTEQGIEIAYMAGYASLGDIGETFFAFGMDAGFAIYGVGRAYGKWEFTGNTISSG